MPNAKHTITAFCAGLVTLCLSHLPVMASDQKFDARTQKLIEDAQKEGSLVYIDNLMAPESREAMNAAFVKHYGLKNFKFTQYLLKSSEVIARVEQELRADKLSADCGACERHHILGRAWRRGRAR